MTPLYELWRTWCKENADAEVEVQTTSATIKGRLAGFDANPGGCLCVGQARPRLSEIVAVKPALLAFGKVEGLTEPPKERT